MPMLILVVVAVENMVEMDITMIPLGSYTIGQNRCGGSASQTAGGKTWSTSTQATFGQGGNASGYSCGGGGGGRYGGGGAYDSDSDSDGRWGGGEAQDMFIPLLQLKITLTDVY